MTDRIFIIVLLLSGAALCPAADNGFERALLPLLENHCFDCHDEDTQKGDLALDSLNPDVVNNGMGIEDGKGSHSTRKLPTLLAGGGKLGIKQGQQLVYEKDTTPLCNLHVTLMQSMGLERDHFVDGMGRLTGLS